MTPLVLPLAAVGREDLERVGGKGANLGELLRAGFEVPPGFCATTRAFELFTAQAGDEIRERLGGLRADDVAGARRAGDALRARLLELPLPPPVERAVAAAWLELGREHAYAVRSSATAEDLPHASFAGQQESYLNVRGRDELLTKVRACFASLFTDRAILYRLRSGFDHGRVALAVVVQRMVPSEVSGIAFTADPVTGHRDVAVIDAGFGLGEALVAGLVSADHYRVDKRTGRVLERRIGDKRLMIRPLPGGGTERVELAEGQRAEPALDDARAAEIAAVGARIEAHFGAPQDIEWALAGGALVITQSRPVTSLYPLPDPPPDDDALHIYFSFSHFQVMTDAMTPLALSWLRTIVPVGHAGGRTESRRLASAGGRLYADLSPLLRHPLGRRLLPRALRNADALAAASAAEVAARPEFRRQGERAALLPILVRARALPPRVLRTLLLGDPEGAVEAVNALVRDEVARVRERFAATDDLAERLEIAVTETRGLFGTVLDSRVWGPSLLAGFAASALLHALVGRGGRAAEDLAAVERGLHGNVATEMNLAVGDLADLARASDALLACLERPEADAEQRLTAAARQPGGERFLHAWNAFLDRYGARGPSEIDLGRPRWAEEPDSLLRMVLGAARGREPGEHRAHHARLVGEGERAAAALAARARSGPWGALHAPLVRRLVRVGRALLPLREHHKYFAMRLMALARATLLEAGARLRDAGRLDDAADVWYLSLPELLDALREEAATPLEPVVRERRAAFARQRELTPPRVITNRGETPVATLDDAGAPAGALVGSPVSAGVVEGPARVVRDPAAQTLRPGEILVAPFTDPGWTPLFVSAAGLVTEVGGLMTHGSLVAREYGIPAVVGVVDATTRIRSGQRLRLYGDRGWVEILDGAPQETSAGGDADPGTDTGTDARTVTP